MRNEDEDKLVVARYNLATWLWDREPIELDLPDEGTDFTAVVYQQRRIMAGKEPILPMVVVQDNNSKTLYENQLNAEADGWQNKWHPERIHHNRRVLTMVPISSTNSTPYYLFFKDEDNESPPQRSEESWNAWRGISRVRTHRCCGWGQAGLRPGVSRAALRRVGMEKGVTAARACGGRARRWRRPGEA